MGHEGHDAHEGFSIRYFASFMSLRQRCSPVEHNGNRREHRVGGHVDEEPLAVAAGEIMRTVSSHTSGRTRLKECPGNTEKDTIHTRNFEAIALGLYVVLLRDLRELRGGFLRGPFLANLDIAHAV
jgi:hypothetical protein